MAESIYQSEAERAVIAGLIQYPDVFCEIQPYIKGSDFSHMHSSIFSVIKQIIDEKGTPDPIIVSARLKALNVRLQGLEVSDYINSLQYFSVEKRNIVELAQEVKKYSIVRNVYLNAERLKQRMLDLKDRPASEILAAIDGAMGDSFHSFDTNDGDAENLYDALPNFVEERGNNPVETVGYKMPFKLWNDYYGGLRRGGIYFTASRSGQGKSTFLSYLGDQVANVCNPGMDIKVLFLDTEMDKFDQMARLAAVRIGCPYYLVDTGEWRTDEEWCPKVKDALNLIRKENRNLYFKQVASMGVDDLINFVKRWYYKNVGEGGNAFIVYDYLKVLMSDSDGRKSEWEVALQKMQKLKDLAVFLNCPLFTALQVTRAGTTTNRDSSEVLDDETVLSISGRIDWLVNYAGILRRKTPDEIEFDGTDFGTHKLITLKSRFQGRISSGHQDLVKIMEKGKLRYRQNYLCFNIENFGVEERGDFRKIAELKGLTKVRKSEDSKETGI